MSQLLNYWSHIFKEHSCPSRLFQYIDVPHNFPLAKQKMFSIEDNGRYIFFQNSKLDDCQHLNRLNKTLRYTQKIILGISTICLW